jgi:hypothetical protein
MTSTTHAPITTLHDPDICKKNANKGKKKETTYARNIAEKILGFVKENY